MQFRKENWVKDLALEAETAITLMPANERDVYRKLAADRIKNIQTQNSHHGTHPEMRTIKSIQRKLQDNNAMIARADKGNTLVMLHTHQYVSKLQDFIHQNDFIQSQTDPNQTFQFQKPSIDHLQKLKYKKYQTHHTTSFPNK
jgi:hypothetical protein